MSDLAAFERADNSPSFPSSNAWSEVLDHTWRSPAASLSESESGIGTLEPVDITYAAGHMFHLLNNGNFDQFEASVRNLLDGQNPDSYAGIVNELEKTLSSYLRSSDAWGLNSMEYLPGPNKIHVGLEDKAKSASTAMLIDLPKGSPWKK